ncbi:MAG: hypothetical protein ACRCY8_16615 [Dermatophilaceae bacterium]
MLAVVLGMLLCLVLAVVVVAVVAVPARRSGRDLLTERGEAVVGGLVEAPRALVSRDDRPAGRHAAPPVPVETVRTSLDEVVAGRP